MTLGAIEGVLVVELAGRVAGALAGMLLCDNGARVVKVEPPGGSPIRAQPGHCVWNRGKESLIADVHEPGGLTVLKRLLAGADVLIHDLPTGVASALGLDHHSLAATQPRLITCSISGYGTKGPLAKLAADDALVAARFGLTGIQCGWLPGPSHIVHPLPSIGAALLAVQGVGVALLARDANGRGQQVETSLMAGTLAMAARVSGEKLPPRRGWTWNAAGPSPFYSAYQCADGKWLHVGCGHAGFVKQAVAAIGIQELAGDPRFGNGFSLPPGAAQNELFVIVAQVMKQRPRAEWVRILEAADVPIAPVQTAAEFLDDPQARVNGIVQVADPEIGPIGQIGLTIRLLETPGRVRGPAPLPGQHTAAILAELSHDHLSSAPHNRSADSAWAAGDLKARDQQPILPLSDSPPPPLSDSSALPEPPLKGLHVLELANIIAGPMVGRLLADLGADVVKLEPPDGGDIARRNGSLEFLALNSGKRGIAVNLRLAAGQEIGRRLAAQADVLVDNMRPGVAERLGMGWEQLRLINPRLIYCHSTAYGSRGPYSHKPGMDPLAGALAGLETAQGASCGKPVYVHNAAVDHSTALLACNGILLALLARARTGRGQRVETSLLDAAALINAPALMRAEGWPPKQDSRRSQYGLHALYRLYETAHGWLCLALGVDESAGGHAGEHADRQDQDRHWQALCRAIGREDLLADPRFAGAAARREHDAALAAVLADVFRQRDAEAWLADLEVAGVPGAPVVEGWDQAFSSDPQVVANGLIVEHDHPTFGAIQLAHRWLKFTETPIWCPAPPPLLGQHTHQVLVDLGYSEAEIEALRGQGVISLGGLS